MNQGLTIKQFFPTQNNGNIPQQNQIQVTDSFKRNTEQPSGNKFSAAGNNQQCVFDYNLIEAEYLNGL